MRRLLFAPVALVGVLLLASPGWAPPPVFRPAPPRPAPVRPPTTMPYHPPTTPYRPPVPIYRPLILPPPDFSRQIEEARRRNAAEAAEMLRRESAARLSRAQRAALLNQIAHDLLRQQQARSLDDLRRLRADWVAIGPGAGLDPLVAMQLEAAESAAERLLLAEVLQLVRDAQYERAEAKLAALDAPRYLPAAVVHALPNLRAALRLITPFTRMQAELMQNASYRTTANLMSGVPHGLRSAAVSGAFLVWGNLAPVENLLASHPPTDKLEAIELVLANVEKVHGIPLASKLRAEVSAQLYLFGRAEDARLLLEGEVDPVHAAAVLADLQAVVLGRGEITTPQVAVFVPTDAKPPAQSIAVLPPDQLAQWKPPTRKPGETTIDAAIADTRAKLKVAVSAEVEANTTKVSAAADRIRAALAAEAAPLKVFIEKVEAVQGKPFASPAERQLAASAGTHGMTVAETLGVLAVEADRPASAVRMLATMPTFGGPGEFAAAFEVSGRAPAAFAAHPDAGFKLGAVHDRARIREAFVAVLNARAAKVVAGQDVPELNRGTLEADIHKRLGFADDDKLTPAECVQAILDVCRDWADNHAHLADAMHELNQAIADATSNTPPDERDDELKELIAGAQIRRLQVQADKKRREAGVVIGCQALGGYGPAAEPAREWLGAQLGGGEKSWQTAANVALGKIGAK